MNKSARDMASVLSYKRREPYQTLRPRFLCEGTNAKPIELMPNRPKADGSMLKNQAAVNSRISSVVMSALILVKKTNQTSWRFCLRRLLGHRDTLGKRPYGLDFVSTPKAALSMGSRDLSAGMTFVFSFVSRPSLKPSQFMWRGRKWLKTN